MSSHYLLRPKHLSSHLRSAYLRHHSPSSSSTFPPAVQSRSHFHRPEHPSPFARIHSSFTGTAVFTFAATSLGIGSLCLYYTSVPSRVDSSYPKLRVDIISEDHTIMVGTPLPGRPGHLTPEEEIKLQEMWTATLKVFGVPALKEGLDADAASIAGSESLEQAEQRSRNGTVGSEKKKKKRSMFGKKQHDGDSVEDNTSAMDGDDKYGQAKDFHKVLESQSPEDLRQAFWSMVKHDNPDGLMLRFLRARKWNVQNALIMLIATMHWRMQEVRVDEDVIGRGEGGAVEDCASSDAKIKKEGEDFLAQLRLGKSYLHGTDREGRPMCVVRVRLHKQGDQSASSVERYTVYTIETARYLLASNVDTAAIVFDMTDFSMANMDYGPVKFMIKCFEANYPESLGIVLVHKSPWIFQGIWKIIKGWLDPVVASKVHFTKTLEELEAFVEKSHIPKELGGSDPWTYQYVEPTPNENSLQSEDGTRKQLLEERAAVIKDYETTTLQWIRDQTSRDTLQRKRAELTERLRVGYWEIDPYLRAKTLYDRTGMIQEGGKIQFYDIPKDMSISKAPVQDGPLPATHGADDLD